MNVPIKLAGFGLGLVAVFGAAAGAGVMAGPLADPTTEHSDSGHASDDASEPRGAHGGGHDAASPDGASDIPGGLMVTRSGHTLDVIDPEFGDAGRLRFQILGPDGEPVTEYTESHGKDLHLIVVRRDMTGYQHLHPTRDAGGTWSTALKLPSAGEYRVFADFAPAGGESLTLGADLSVPGGYEPQALPEPVRTARVDGYTVTLEGTLIPGEQSELTFSVSKDGEPVTDLEPYLEAYGHLVALRDGDLAYLHVHPDGSPGDASTEPGPEVTFYARTPTAGDYRLFLDFKHRGKVRTAEFTATATADGAGAARNASEHDHAD